MHDLPSKFQRAPAASPAAHRRRAAGLSRSRQCLIEARQGGDPHANCTPPPASSRNMPSNALCGTAAVGAPHFGCSSVLREHLCTIRSACLVNRSSENTQNTAPSSCSRACVSRLLLCSPRDGLCSITFNKPTTSVTRHQLDTRDSVHSRQELRKCAGTSAGRARVWVGAHTRARLCGYGRILLRRHRLVAPSASAQAVPDRLRRPRLLERLLRVHNQLVRLCRGVEKYCSSASAYSRGAASSTRTATPNIGPVLSISLKAIRSRILVTT